MLRSSSAAAFAAAILIMTSGGAAAEHRTCFDTTKIMRTACRADTLDNFFVTRANCLNSDDVRACHREARADLRSGREECRDQARARNSLCRRLPDPGPYVVDLDPDDFAGGCEAGNRFFPLTPGTVTTFVNPVEDEKETIIVTVTGETREIEGIEAVVVNDRVFEGLPDDDGNPTGDPIEDTDDYYAVANNCDVYYLGEIAQNFEDGFLTDLDGSFIVGEERAQAGIIMLANPENEIGTVYRQEFALGEAEDAAEVLSASADVDLRDEPFSEVPVECHGECLMTEDFIGNSLDDREFKFYVPGIGVIAETDVDGEVVLKLIKIEHHDDDDD